MTTSGLARFVFTDSATDAGTPIYDSGWVPAWEQTVVWGSRPTAAAAADRRRADAGDGRAMTPMQIVGLV
jgi:hypothetical protein